METFDKLLLGYVYLLQPGFVGDVEAWTSAEGPPALKFSHVERHSSEEVTTHRPA